MFQGMLRTSRCFVRTFLKLGGPDEIVAVVRDPCSFPAFFDFSVSNSSFAAKFFSNLCAWQFISGPLFAAQMLGGNPAAQFAVIAS